MARATTTRAALSLLVCGAMAAAVVLLGPVGPAGAATQQVDLWAVSGNTTLPGGQSVPVWGYSSTNVAAPRPGGPTIVVDKGDAVTITLHNQLPETTSLLVQGQPLVPDRAGIGNGQQKSYTFTADQPGTYLYEAGLVPNAQHQVAMGLYGALVVRPPTANRAYQSADTDVDTTFDESSTLVLGEIDPALNTAADKVAFDMRKYAPRYFLVNGKAYPDTDPIPTTAGHTVLLRYVNAGTQYRSMGVLGQQQTLVGLDGSPLRYARHAVAETFGPGQSADALVGAPSATSDAKLSVYDAGLQLHNTNTAGVGGMLTTVNAAAPPPPAGGVPDTSGPATRAVAYNGTTHALAAVVNDAATGGSNVAQAEYFLDDVGAAGSGTPMTGTFGTPSVSVGAPVTLPTGEHILYVRGRDAAAATNWGPVSSVLVSGGDAGGPATKSPTLSPRLTNHSSTGVAVSATGDDTGSGGSNITGAEYFLDLDPLAPLPADGSGTAMTVNTAAPIASIDATIPASVVNALPEGPHVVSLHSKDAGSNWGDLVTVELVVDTTGPGTSGITASPNPSNGLIAFNAGTPSIRVMAQTLSDPVSNNANSTIKAGEAFIDTVGTSGSGIPLSSSDGVFNDAQEGGYADIPLPTIRALSNGPHTLYVHAKDEAGNWGATTTGTLVVDKTGPSVTAVSAAPNPSAGAASVTLNATATDSLSTITAAEWFTGTDPGVGNATSMTVAGSGASPATLSASVSTSGLPEGSNTLRVRARDAAGNWSAVATTTLTVSRRLYFSTLGNTNPPGVAGTADDADIYLWSGSAFSRFIDVSTLGIPTGANVDGYDRVDNTHFYVSFSADTTVPGLGAVQDEDVLYYNAGTWSVFFNGTAHGLTAANLDLDAISVSGGIVYFSTAGNTNPPGVAGTADDADVYSYNATTNAYARVWDSSANGVAAAANVDGLVRTDATHLLLSFAADTTLTGPGAVQDEDVVAFNAGTWQAFFDGTAKGLTNANHDVDAFDVP